MSSFPRTKIAVGVMAVMAVATIVYSVRTLRKPVQPPDTGLETGNESGAPAIETAGAASEGPTTVQRPAVKAEQPATVAIKVPPPAPETGTRVPVTTAPPVSTFSDPRNIDLAGLPKRTPVQPEAGTSVPRAAPAPARNLFDDNRAGLTERPTAPSSPTGEQPSRQVNLGARPQERSTAERTTEVVRAAPAAKPSFADPRGLIGESPAGVRPIAPSFSDPREPASPAPVPAATAPTQETPTQATIVAAAQPAAAVAPAEPRVTFNSPAPAAACEPPQIATEPLDGGRMLLRVASPCRADQTVRLGYGEATLVGRLDGGGRLEVTLDLFAGTASPVEVTFADGISRDIPARANDLDKVEKIALIWRTPVNLDLHAFEYGASFGEAGHVWSGAPASAISARDQTAANKRGRGFLSRSDSGQGPGDKIEIYTFYRHPEQAAGVVSIAVDYASRGELPAGASCGTGAQAEVRFETVHTARGRVTREAGVLASAACGRQLSPDARFGAVHQIRINR